MLTAVIQCTKPARINDAAVLSHKLITKGPDQTGFGYRIIAISNMHPHQADQAYKTRMASASKHAIAGQVFYVQPSIRPAHSRCQGVAAIRSGHEGNQGKEKRRAGRGPRAVRSAWTMRSPASRRGSAPSNGQGALFRGKSKCFRDKASSDRGECDTYFLKNFPALCAMQERNIYSLWNTPKPEVL